MSRSDKTQPLNAKKIIIGIVILTIAVVFGLSILKESMKEDAAVPLLTPLPGSEEGEWASDWSEDEMGEEESLEGDPSEAQEDFDEFGSEDSSLDEEAPPEESSEEEWGGDDIP